MKCGDAKQQITEYLDGELEAEQKARLEEHLAACEVCTRELAEQRRLIEGVKALPKVPAPADFARRVSAAIARETPGRPSRGRWIKRYGAMAASIALVIVAATLWLKEKEAPHDGIAKAPARRLKGEITHAEKPPGGIDALKTPQKELLEDLAAVQPLAEAPALAPAKEPDRAKQAPPTKKKALEKMPESVAPRRQLAEAVREKPPTRQEREAEKPEDEEVTNRRLFDLVVESDSPKKCLDDLAAFLEERGVDVTARISARRAIILAQIGEQAVVGIAGQDRAPRGFEADFRSRIIAQIAASGKFNVVRPGAPRDAAIADAEGRVPGKARFETQGRKAAALLETGRAAPDGAVLAILVVGPADSSRPPAAEAQTNGPPTGQEPTQQTAPKSPQADTQ